jgi:hypothetical protein
MTGYFMVVAVPLTVASSPPLSKRDLYLGYFPLPCADS